MGFQEDIEMVRRINGDLEKLVGKRKARETFDLIRDDVLRELKLNPNGYSLSFETGDWLRKLINLRAYEYIRKRLVDYKDYFSEELYKKLKDDIK